MKDTITASYGCMVFNDSVMRDRLPKEVYKSLKETRELGKKLDKTVAETVANSMKDWAIEKGATHYTHWFQPMTGITAEKHDSFLTPVADCRAIMEFSGKELVKGESDASSFPSGGLRATFEARGYTAWDPTSYAFIKDGSLYIPTVFCSYSGEVLDKKTPLLRSMDAISKQAMRILNLFGNTTAKTVTTTVGAEQEYFLIDKSLYDLRDDLKFTGRTLFGCKAPKGQEMEDHYFGTLKDRVASYMKALDEELWKLGIPSKTKHNEVAPSQHEMAPLFETSNLATDHNQLTMDIMRKLALKHGLVCLLHEKPFEYISGSGKHNNWSMSTDDGQNLLDPSDTPQKNIRFLTFLCAVIKAVDEYADLLRLSVASAGNDHRLGANEAPPAIISMFLGDELTSILEGIEKGILVEPTGKVKFEFGLAQLPKFPKDTTDRNRTSPFAFTGNKFEFRSLGSSASIACTNMMLNTAVAEELKQFADALEGKTGEEFDNALNTLLAKTISEHKRVIFNGNSYSEEWLAEAENRGLYNLPNTVEALKHYTDDKNVGLLVAHSIFTQAEVQSRRDILLEEYYKTINIEANVMVQMTHQQIIPASFKFLDFICTTCEKKKSVGLASGIEVKTAQKLSHLIDELDTACEALEHELTIAKGLEGVIALSEFYCNSILPKMAEMRRFSDCIEKICPKEIWPFPTYTELLFSV